MEGGGGANGDDPHKGPEDASQFTGGIGPSRRTGKEGTRIGNLRVEVADADKLLKEGGR